MNEIAIIAKKLRKNIKTLNLKNSFVLARTIHNHDFLDWDILKNLTGADEIKDDVKGRCKLDGDPYGRLVFYQNGRRVGFLKYDCTGYYVD